MRSIMFGLMVLVLLALAPVAEAGLVSETLGGEWTTHLIRPDLGQLGTRARHAKAPVVLEVCTDIADEECAPTPPPETCVSYGIWFGFCF